MRVYLFLFPLFFTLNFSISAQKRFEPLLKQISKSSVKSRNNYQINNAVITKVNNRFLDKLYSNDNTVFEASIPIDNYGEEIDLHFTQFDLTNPDFEVLNSEGQTITYKRGKYFSALSEDKKSMGAFSFYNYGFMGILSQINGISYNIGKIPLAEDTYIVYRDVDFDTGLSFYCDTDDKMEKIADIRDINKVVSRGKGKCINLYAEADYALFVQNGRNIGRTVDFVLGLFAESALLYKKEGVNIKISQVKVWDTKDGYNTKSSYTALDQFVNNNKNKEMDLGILLALGADGLGGLAYISGLCTHKRHFAYANIRKNYSNVPIYSWSAMVITHELGHNLGSLHTHSCSWNGNNTQIDDCGNLYYFNNGQTPEGKYCFDEDNPIIPADGGTIMSYCHLVGSAGINLAKGFGNQPNKVINRTVANANCLDICESLGDKIPVTDFEGFRDFTCVGGDLKFFDKSANHPSEWIWIFEKKNGMDTMYHKYPKMRYENPGVYDVSLISINSAGSDTLKKNDYIKVIEGPTADFEYEFIEKNRVQFKNKSKLSNKYFWKFGDGLISLSANPKHRYKDGGNYVVELRAVRDTCSTSVYFMDTIEVKIPLKAKFSASSKSICRGDTVVFQVKNENYDSVKWFFENGIVLDEDSDNIKVLYENSGSYNVQLIAYSKYGVDTLTKADYINVLSIPIADFNYTISNDTIFFYNLSENSTGYIWYFNGTRSSFTEDPIYKFGDKLEVEVKLVAVNKCYKMIITKKIITTNIEEFESGTDIFMYPNPNTGKFNFKLNLDINNNSVLKIFNIYGKLVYSKSLYGISKNQNEFIIDIESPNSGLYYLSVWDKTNIIYKKVFTVIEK